MNFWAEPSFADLALEQGAEIATQPEEIYDNDASEEEREAFMAAQATERRSDVSEQLGTRLFLGERVVFWPRRRYVIVCECGWSADVRRRGKAVRLGNRHRAADHPPRQGLMRFERTKGEAA